MKKILNYLYQIQFKNITLIQSKSHFISPIIGFELTVPVGITGINFFKEFAL
jgi:hypothetical protein